MRLVLGILGVVLAIAGVAGVIYLLVANPTPVHDDPNALPTRAAAPPAAGFEDAAAQSRQLARRMVLENSVPGTSIAVAVDGKIVWAEGVGWADLDRRIPVTPDTRFRIGGVSQALTSAAVGLLHERGRIDLDAPVQQYVPTFPRQQWPITTRQLMSHTSGMPQQTPSGRPCADVSEAIGIYKNEPLLFQPGKSYQFSTFGWIVVSAAAQAAAGEPLPAFMQREIFKPLGMHATVPDAKDVPNLTHLYHPGRDLDTLRGIETASDIDYSCYGPAGFYLSTPSDLVRFGSAMLRGNLLKPETVTMLQTPVMKDSALGWKVESAPINGKPARLVSQRGSPFGGTASLLILPEHGIAVSVIANVTFAKGVTPLSIRIAELFARR